MPLLSDRLFRLLAMDYAIGILLIFAGIGMIVFRKPLARRSIIRQNALWGFKFGEKHVRNAEVGAFLTGLASIGLGIAILFGVGGN